MDKDAINPSWADVIHQQSFAFDEAKPHFSMPQSQGRRQEIVDAFVAAAAQGNVKAVWMHLNFGVPVDEKNTAGYTALYCAAYAGHEEVVQLLLQNGAFVNTKCVRGYTALAAAAAKYQPEVVKLLLSHHTDVALVTDDGTTLLGLAVQSGASDIVEMLLACGMDVNAACCREGVLPLTLALQQENTALADLLLRHHANPNAMAGNHPLLFMMISENDNDELVTSMAEVLLRHGANPNTLYNHATPLMAAAHNGMRQVVQELLRNGADPSIVYPPNKTAADFARTQGHHDIARLILASLPSNSLSLNPKPPPKPASQKTKQPRVKQAGIKQTGIVQSVGTLSPPKVNQKTNVLLPAKLDGLVGLEEVKDEVVRMINFLSIAKMRQDKGLPAPPQSRHMVFTGNPGTGKTTVARLLAEIFQAKGFLSKGQLIEADKSKLVGTYIGETPTKTRGVVESALGGVLFIDEAYSLLTGNDRADAYGQEAVDTLLKLMEDHRDDLIVIVAGYTEPMKKFLKSNPGLQSRFNRYLDFPDYDPAALSAVFLQFLQQNKYTLTPAAQTKIQSVFENAYSLRDETFGNARLARNLFEQSVSNQATRLVSRSSVSQTDLVTIVPEDIPGPAAAVSDLDALLGKLDRLVGLAGVKGEVTQLINLLRINQMRKDKGLPVKEQSLHMVFTGNPGTGKTTVARLLSQILRSLGILKKGQCIEVDRSGLVGQYLGQTGPRVQEVVKEAAGGVLFIDEAYSLTQRGMSGGDAYGEEAVNTLLKLMEDKRESLVVIVAGYTEPMQQFLESNPGLQSRFTRVIEFADYSGSELTQIFHAYAQKGFYTVTEEAGAKVALAFEQLYQRRDATFGNARLVRNWFEKTLRNQANRLASLGTLEGDQLVTLTEDDIPCDFV